MSARCGAKASSAAVIEQGKPFLGICVGMQRNVTVATLANIQVVEISSCSASGPCTIMDTRDPAVANDQRKALVA
jgi:gamma-glutamyl-gamma-aminobutyrate hydrolase PuuD